MQYRQLSAGYLSTISFEMQLEEIERSACIVTDAGWDHRDVVPAIGAKRSAYEVPLAITTETLVAIDVARQGGALVGVQIGTKTRRDIVELQAHCGVAAAVSDFLILDHSSADDNPNAHIMPDLAKWLHSRCIPFYVEGNRRTDWAPWYASGVVATAERWRRAADGLLSLWSAPSVRKWGTPLAKVDIAGGGRIVLDDIEWAIETIPS